jgi:hypothetical protein
MGVLQMITSSRNIETNERKDVTDQRRFTSAKSQGSARECGPIDEGTQFCPGDLRM